MADNIKYRFIQNVGDYFPSGYFTDDFLEKVQKCANIDKDGLKSLNDPFVRLHADYNEYKNDIINNDSLRRRDAIKKTHDFNTKLLKVLGYSTDHPYQEPFVINETSEKIEMIPVRHIIRRGDQVSLLVMEMQHLIAIGDQEPAGLFEQQYESELDKNTKQQRYKASDWEYVFKIGEEYKISPAIVNKAITQIFLMPEEQRPHFILMLAGNIVFLFDRDKWARGSYLQFSLDDLFMQAQIPAFRNYYALFNMLVSKDTLAADGQVVLMDTLIEESFKNAYEVTKDLKEGVILAVETLANEALHYMKNVAHRPFGKYVPETDSYDETDDAFEAEVKDDCLTIVYRLLFILYAESRTELGILPTDDEVYKKGYSFEALRDLEQVRLISQDSLDGYFFDYSIKHLFKVLSDGYRSSVPLAFTDKSFSVRKIDSPLFNDNKLKQLKEVKFRNSKWQEIIKALSLSKSRKYCGRISYANLGVNQLGSVYESLLAYRGFYAEEDYIEVHKANEPEDGTFLVPYSRMESFDRSEILWDEENDCPKKLKKGTFVYRLNGRDRQKSASYYTPEVLTRSTVKYTLKTIIEEVAEGKRKPQELLDLKILEPAMGAAAFQNEVINQLAEAYMTYVEKKPSPDDYRDELQKVKAYIATHNVYGVDLNPTAIELGKLSLWLNVIHKDMETPFFANRLAVGNAVIGAWLKVYNKAEVVATRSGNRLVPTEWWSKAPHKVKFYQSRVNRSVNEVYHFLLPDKAMLAVRGIKEMAKEHTREKTVMDAKLKDWTSMVTEESFATLQRISAKIDLLLREHLETQVSIERYTNNKKAVWGVPGDAELNLEGYAEKERLFDTRYNHDNAYYKLKMVMDYWCSLWFWEYEDAASLPTRAQYWEEIELLLDVDESRLDRNTLRAMARNTGSETLDLGTERMTEEQAEIVTKSKEEILHTVHTETTLFPEEEPLRFKIVSRLAERYHFFHPMLEFIEVFWLRDGFDIICGNPPWIKLQFDDKAVLSERFPEVAIRKISAPAARAMKDTILQDQYMRNVYTAEEIETECQAAYLNAYSNYPLLVGQQTNLYKCVLTNCFDLSSDTGYIGILCPESIYDDPKGHILRQEMYRRLRYHFQYQNEIRLFAEVHHHTVYGDQLLGPRSSSPNFLSIHNLFHPNTVDACFAHDGHGECGGIKDEEGHWNTKAHANRIVHFTEAELNVLSKTFENSDDWQGTKLVSIHNKEIVEILKKFSAFPTHVEDVEYSIQNAHHETGAVDAGIIQRNTVYPDFDKYEMVFNGPQFHVANPLYKTPRSKCVLNSDFDIIDIETASDDCLQRTNYTPCIPVDEYKSLIKGFPAGQDSNGDIVYDNWMDYYKVTMRCMLAQTGERTLICAVLPRKTAHIHAVVSTTFRTLNNCVDMAGLCASLPLDFYIKTIGIGQIAKVILKTFPLGTPENYKSSLFARTLRLNCVTNRYAELWSEVWDESYKSEQWSIEDSRLAPWDILTPEWNHDTPLRNYFERRQALVEIDVIAAMALGLTLDELIMMYEIQFPVLQQNENDTWYDANGRIVFTCSKGLVGVGLDRPEWEKIKDLEAGQTYTHTIEKSELYYGQEQTFVAPFTKCDRVEDYRKAWAFFEERFK